MDRPMLVRSCLRWAAMLVGCVSLVFAQEQGGQAPGGQQPGGGGTPGGGTPGGGRPTSPQQPGEGRGQFPGQERQQFPEMERPIFLQGKVMLDDGTPAPPQTVIERVCNGRPIPEGYADSKGRFSFQLGQNTSFIADASFGGDDRDMTSMNRGMGNPQTGGGMGGPTMGGRGGRGVSERDLVGCELRASLPGYRSSSVELSGRRMFDNPDVGTIMLRGSPTSRVLRSAP